MSESRLRIARMALLATMALVIVGVLTYTFKDYVRQVLAFPATRILWFVRLLIDSTPQIFFWLLLLTILCVAGIQSLSAGKHPLAPQVVAEHLQPFRRERIAFWSTQVALALSGDRYSRIRMAGHLGDLTLLVLAHQQKVDRKEIRLLISQKKLDLPPEVEACVKARFEPILKQNPGFWASIWLGIRRVFPFLEKSSKQQMNLYPDLAPGDEIEAIIHYLEKQLEVRDDSRD